MRFLNNIYNDSYFYKDIEFYINVFQIDDNYFLIGIQNWELDINCGGYIYIKTKYVDKIIIKGIKRFIPKLK